MVAGTIAAFPTNVATKPLAGRRWRLQRVIATHPALLWKALNVRQH